MDSNPGLATSISDFGYLSLASKSRYNWELKSYQCKMMMDKGFALFKNNLSRHGINFRQMVKMCQWPSVGQDCLSVRNSITLL